MEHSTNIDDLDNTYEDNDNDIKLAGKIINELEEEYVDDNSEPEIPPPKKYKKKKNKDVELSKAISYIVFEKIKKPLVVAILVFLITNPKVSNMVVSLPFIQKFETNFMMLNIVKAVFVASLFFFISEWIM